MPNSEAFTRGFRVQVESTFVPERSDPATKQWFFAYRIRVANEGQETAQLVSRHWVITDANGKVEEIRGPGVVGKQPVLSPGRSFEYTSFCPLATSFGTMHGTFQMITQSREEFDVTVAPFSLCEPYAIN